MTRVNYWENSSERCNHPFLMPIWMRSSFLFWLLKWMLFNVFSHTWHNSHCRDTEMATHFIFLVEAHSLIVSFYLCLFVNTLINKNYFNCIFDFNQPINNQTSFYSWPFLSLWIITLFFIKGIALYHNWRGNTCE